MARNDDSDLVVIFDDKIPVVKIISVSKLLYEKQKKAKELRKNSKQITVKSLQVRIVTSPHDLEILRSKARKFLENEDKVLFQISDVAILLKILSKNLKTFYLLFRFYFFLFKNLSIYQ